MLTVAELEARKRLDSINFALTKAAWELERARFFRPQSVAVRDETDESAQSISSGAAATATSKPGGAWHEEAKES